LIDKRVAYLQNGNFMHCMQVH